MGFSHGDLGQQFRSAFCVHLGTKNYKYCQEQELSYCKRKKLKVRKVQIEYCHVWIEFRKLLVTLSVYITYTYTCKYTDTQIQMCVHTRVNVYAFNFLLWCMTWKQSSDIPGAMSKPAIRILIFKHCSIERSQSSLEKCHIPEQAWGTNKMSL